MFERFTDRARRSVVLSQEEARQLGCPEISTEHILLGLLNEGEGVAAQVLLSFGLTLDNMRDRVASDNSISTAPLTSYGHLPYTKPGKRTMENSLREALLLGHNYVGTEHILLSITRPVGRGFAYDLLEHTVPLGGAQAVRDRVLELLRSYRDNESKDATAENPFDAIDEALVGIRTSFDALIKQVNKLRSASK